ncbi:hypothetical protein FOQG_18386 [Fusarium oxysporum f. sp. raphani 54005]|uniref:Uncharacterized protein n=1 Tax=Fusarium oxysporum f. sp. raphani 54005 TaxID=1089458 RepID=X0B551_FUSOX|nr:hypothetical protein FOQG_18386 [Fusarium oxysporum f. sp. raphani 54005]
MANPTSSCASKSTKEAVLLMASGTMKPLTTTLWNPRPPEKYRLRLPCSRVAHRIFPRPNRGGR